jgi:hypothetical protein
MVAMAAFCAAVATQAAASIALSEVPFPSKTKTFRALKIEDVTGVDDKLQLNLDEVRDGFFGVAARGGFTGSVPSGCEPSRYGVQCPLADYDTLLINTAAGNDKVSYRIPSRRVRRRAILQSPNVTPFVNAVLGAGNDRWSSSGKGSLFLDGGAGRDALEGGDSDDVLSGGPGSDGIRGGGGANFMLGGGGGDRIAAGGRIPDIMLGGKGRDLCKAILPRDKVGGCERVTLRGF